MMKGLMADGLAGDPKNESGDAEMQRCLPGGLLACSSYS